MSRVHWTSFVVCALMKYWEGLYVEADKEQLVDGISVMLEVAKRVLKQQKEDAEAATRLLNDNDDAQDDMPV